MKKKSLQTSTIAVDDPQFIIFWTSRHKQQIVWIFFTSYKPDPLCKKLHLGSIVTWRNFIIYILFYHDVSWMSPNCWQGLWVMSTSGQSPITNLQVPQKAWWLAPHFFCFILGLPSFSNFCMRNVVVFVTFVLLNNNAFTF